MLAVKKKRAGKSKLFRCKGFDRALQIDRDRNRAQNINFIAQKNFNLYIEKLR